jgi:hypothetical protein
MLFYQIIYYTKLFVRNLILLKFHYSLKTNMNRFKIIRLYLFRDIYV